MLAEDLMRRRDDEPSGWGGLASGLASELLARSFATSGLAGSLLCASHLE